ASGEISVLPAFPGNVFRPGGVVRPAFSFWEYEHGRWKCAVSSNQRHLDGIHFQFRLAMAAGGGACVCWKAEAIEDRAKRQYSHEEHGNVEVTQLRSGR